MNDMINLLISMGRGVMVGIICSACITYMEHIEGKPWPMYVKIPLFLLVGAGSVYKPKQ